MDPNLIDFVKKSCTVFCKLEIHSRSREYLAHIGTLVGFGIDCIPQYRPKHAFPLNMCTMCMTMIVTLSKAIRACVSYTLTVNSSRIRCTYSWSINLNGTCCCLSLLSGLVSWI